jgi:hypothetical protein
MRCIRFLPVLAAILALVACGSSNGEQTDNGALDMTPVDTSYGYDEGSDVGPIDDTGPGDMGSDVPLGSREIVFQVDTTFPQQVPATQSFTIRARLLDRATGDPVPATVVGFEITYVEDLTGEEIFKWDSELDSPSAISNSEGRFEVAFKAGETTQLVYTVTLTAEDTAPSTIKLAVLALSCGCLAVNIGYDGEPGPAARFAAKVFDGAETCDGIRENGFPALTVGEQTTTDMGAPIDLTCVPPGRTVTVWVDAQVECPFASGCVEGVVIGAAGADCAVADVPLGDVETTLEGSYNGIHQVRLGEAQKDCAGVDTATACTGLDALDFGTLACCYLNQVEDVFKADGDDLAARMKTAAVAWEGTKLSAGQKATLDSAIDGIVPGAVTDNQPAWVGTFAQVGTEVLKTVRVLNLGSTIEIQAMDDEGSAQGNETWTTYTLYWKLGCDVSDPNFFECGRVVYEMKAFGGLSYSPAIPANAIETQLLPGGRFELKSHVVKLNLGKLIAFVTNELAGQALTGGKIQAGQIKGGQAKTLQESARLRFACGEVADALFADVDSWFSGTRDDLQTLCRNAVDTLIAPSAATMVVLTKSSELSLSGTGSYSDRTCNGSADLLQSGEYLGTFVPSAGASVEITGSFSGTRK